MLLQGKNAVIYGGGGSLGSAVAQAFVREGAQVVLAGRTLAKVQRVADELVAAGGKAEAAAVDALDETAVRTHLDGVVERLGRIDISFNAISIRGDLQGRPLLTMSAEDFMTPVLVGVKAHYLTATAAARHMVNQGAGVILTLTTPAAGMSGRDYVMHNVGGFAAACAGIEGFTRSLAGEVGRQGVRVMCLRSHAIPEAWAANLPPEVQEIIAQMAAGTAYGRLPTLAEFANGAVLAASDYAATMTGTIANLTCGAVMDTN